MSIIRPAKEPMREEGIWFPPLHRESPFSHRAHILIGKDNKQVNIQITKKDIIFQHVLKINRRW